MNVPRVKVRGAAYATVWVTIVAVALTTLVLLGQTRELAGAIRKSQKTNSRTYAVVRDCTEPDGACARADQRRTAELARYINGMNTRASAAAVYCLLNGDAGDTYAVVYACMVEQMEQRVP